MDTTSEQIELPEILDIPPKLLPIITEFNKYKYFDLYGGRGGGKSHAIGRFILYLCEQRKVRVFCGRELQANIEESVYTLLKDLIENYNLAFKVGSKKITHLVTGSEIKFKGFREQGSVNVKGLEGVDILWIDEAQSIASTTLKAITPTIRKNKAKVFFTRNPFMYDDAVDEYTAGRTDTLRIKINYTDNPHCPQNQIEEAEICKAKSERDYNHIWLGFPLSTGSDYLFNYEKLYQSFDVVPLGETFLRQRILSIDFAAQGDDMCVATVLDRLTNQHWQLTERIVWDEADAMVSVGKIVALIGQFKPDVTILDVGGMGHVVHNRLTEVGMKVERFDGASVAGVDTIHYANARAHGYYSLKDWFDNGFLKIDKKDIEVIKQLEKIKIKHRSDGRRIIQAKPDMKKDMGYSPDDADSLMMAVFGAMHYLGRGANSAALSNTLIKRVSGSRRKR